MRNPLPPSVLANISGPAAPWAEVMVRL